MPLITTTRTQRSWPRRYRTYYQETAPPYRRADPATVYRIGTLGLVVGRWTSRAHNEHQALTDALGARPASVLASDGQLLPNYRRTPPETAACSPADPPTASS
ncbi:hypothetical protein AB0M10_15390 [Streptomyces sp. NPDC051840]|uniref:hypothetical protein n=1 Tax=Streptomyces sp. NPDC051840 TaxID=3154752 RepID=UPI00342334F2